jgi:hypothetical protein
MSPAVFAVGDFFWIAGVPPEFDHWLMLYFLI